MVRNKTDDMIKCKTCKYEFLVLNHDRCPKCGDTLREVEKAPFVEKVIMSDSLSIEQKHLIKRKIVHYFIDVMIILISLISIFIGYFVNPFINILIGVLVFIITYYLGKKYAEKWIIKEIIERDHYH